MMWMWPFVLVSWHVLNCQGQTIFPAIGYNPDLIPKLREDGTLDCRGGMQVNRKHNICQFYKTPVMPNMSGQLVESSYFQFIWKKVGTEMIHERCCAGVDRGHRHSLGEGGGGDSDDRWGGWSQLGQCQVRRLGGGWVVMAGKVGWSGDCIWVTYSLNDYLEDDWGTGAVSNDDD